MPRVYAARRAPLTQKPPVGAVLQRGHPQAIGLQHFWWLAEWGGTRVENLASPLNYGTLTTQTTVPTWLASPSGPAVQVGSSSGAGAYIAINDPANAINYPNAFTIAAWCFPISTLGGGPSFALIMDRGFFATTGHGIGLNSSGDPFVYTNNTILASTVAATNGRWHHIVGTYNGATLTIYLDGVACGTANVATGTIDLTRPCVIGAQAKDATQRGFNGYIGSVAFWNRNMGGDEVQRLYVDPYGMVGPPARRLWLAQGGGTTTYNQALTGSMVGTGGITRQTGKRTAGTVSPAGAITRQAAKALGASIAEGGTLARSSSKVLSGATTPTGTLGRQADKGMAGSTTPTGGLQLQTGKGLTGILTPAGSIIRQAGKSLAGSSTLAGSVQVQTAKALGASVAAAGGLVRQARKALTAPLPLAGAAARQIDKALAAALTPAGTLASAAMHVLMVALTATLAPAGGMVRQTNRVLSSVLTPVGALGRTTARLFTASLTGVGSLLAGVPHLFLVALAASITPAASLHRRIGRVLGAALGVVGFLAGTPTRRTPVRVHPRTVGETLPALRVQAAGPTTRTVQQAPSWRLRLVAEPAEPLPPVALPEGARVVPLGSAVRVLQAGAPEHTVARPTPIVRIVRRK